MPSVIWIPIKLWFSLDEGTFWNNRCWSFLALLPTLFTRGSIRWRVALPKMEPHPDIYNRRAHYEEVLVRLNEEFKFLSKWHAMKSSAECCHSLQRGNNRMHRSCSIFKRHSHLSNDKTCMFDHMTINMILSYKSNRKCYVLWNWHEETRLFVIYWCFFLKWWKKVKNALSLTISVLNLWNRIFLLVDLG